MDLNGDVWGVDEEGFQILDVLVDPFGFMAVWPGDDDVLCVALLESVPFLIAKDVEVEHVERLEVLFNSQGLSLGLRGRKLRALGGRLSGRRRAHGDESDDRH